MIPDFYQGATTAYMTIYYSGAFRDIHRRSFSQLHVYLPTKGSLQFQNYQSAGRGLSALIVAKHDVMDRDV